MGVKWVYFGRGQYVQEVLHKRLAPMHAFQSGKSVQVYTSFLSSTFFSQPKHQAISQQKVHGE